MPRKKFFRYAHNLHCQGWDQILHQIQRALWSSSDNRSKPRLWNAYNAMLHRMNSIIIHILLLFMKFDDSKIQVDILTWHSISITHELFRILEIHRIKQQEANIRYLNSFFGLAQIFQKRSAWHLVISPLWEAPITDGKLFKETSDLINDTYAFESCLTIWLTVNFTAPTFLSNILVPPLASVYNSYISLN